MKNNHRLFYYVFVSLFILIAGCRQKESTGGGHPQVPSPAEAVYDMRTDTFNLYGFTSVGAELRLQNSTRGIKDGLLTNINDSGLTQFRKLDLVDVGSTGIGIVGQDTIQLDKLQYYLPTAGGNVNGKTNIIVGADGYRLGIMKSAATSQSGNGSLGAPSTYLQLGGGEWNVNSYRMIGLGYLASLTDNPPAQMGYQETVKTGSTFGDLVFATRSVNTNTAPTIRFRIQSGGNVKSYGPITDIQDVATKGYVDTMTMSVKTVTPTGTYNVNGTPSNTLIANNASAAATFNMPTARNGATYVFWKIGASVMTIAGAITDAGKNGSKVVSGAETGSSITLTCVGSSWLITAKNGSWTTQ